MMANYGRNMLCIRNERKIRTLKIVARKMEINYLIISELIGSLFCFIM
jgi:hypothetical protein